MKKFSWSAFFAGLFTDIGMQVIQLIIVAIVYVFLRSPFLSCIWYIVSEIIVSVFVGYVIGKVAKEAPLFMVVQTIELFGLSVGASLVKK